jgi:hypothetical membrane protein
MNFFTSKYQITSTTLFVLAILFAHIFSTNNYDWSKNTISDLGSQGYERKLIMLLRIISVWLFIAKEGLFPRNFHSTLHQTIQLNKDLFRFYRFFSLTADNNEKIRDS